MASVHQSEAKHIKAVKEPWWCSSHYNMLGQMLLTSQWLNKLTAAHMDFTDHGILNGLCLQGMMVIYLASIEEEPEGPLNNQEPVAENDGLADGRQGTLPEDVDVDGGPVDSGAVNEVFLAKTPCV